MESSDWTDAERRVERAAELFEQRKLDEALEELRYAVDVNPYNAGWLFNLAVTLDELGRFDEAIEVYRQTLQLEPDDVSTWYRLGVNLHRAGRFSEAVDALDRATAIDPEFEPAYCTLIASHAELGDHDAAEQAFYLGRLVKDHCPACYFNLGLSLAARGMEDRAIYCWQQTLELHPTHPTVHGKLAEAFRNRGELARARKHYLARLRQESRDFDTLLRLTDLLVQMGRVDEAFQRIEAAQADGVAHVQFARGICLLAQNLPTEAADAFSAVLRLDPTFPRAHLRMAQIRLRAGKLIEAKTHLRSELLLRPDDPQTLRDLANLLIDTAETRSAVACLRRLTAIRPDDVSSWQNLAIAYFLRHQYDDGIAACRHGLMLQPGHVPTIHNLSVALAELGQYDEALATIRSLPAPALTEFADLVIRLQFQRARAHTLRWLGGVLQFLRFRERG